MKYDPPSPEKIRRDVRAVQQELDPIQLAIFSRMPPDQKMQMVSRNIDAARRLIFATERDRYPNLPDWEIHKRALKRFMRFSEWEPEERARIEAFLDEKLQRYYAANEESES